MKNQRIRKTAPNRSNLRRNQADYQALEQRRLLAVSTLFTNNTLLVSGEADGDVELIATGEASVDVIDNNQAIGSFSNVDNLRISLMESGNKKVTIDLGGHELDNVFAMMRGGDHELVVANGKLTDGLRYIGGSGVDDVTIALDADVHNVRMRLGAGDDIVMIAGDVTGYATIQGGMGNDTITVDHKAVIEENLFATLGSGDNEFVHNGEIQGRMVVYGRDGMDKVTVTRKAIVSGASQIIVGDGDNEVYHEGTIESMLNVRTLAGDDVISIEETGSARDRVFVSMGTGTNTFTHLGIIDGDLEVNSNNENDVVNIDASSTVTGTTTVNLAYNPTIESLNFLLLSEARKKYSAVVFEKFQERLKNGIQFQGLIR